MGWSSIKMAYRFIKAEQVRKVIRSEHFGCSEKFLEALDAEIIRIIKRCEDRAKTARRKTVFAGDL